MTKSISKN